jgi:hypothetical protein
MICYRTLLPYKATRAVTTLLTDKRVKHDNPREMLLAGIKGKEVIVSDIYSVFEGWRQLVNPHIDAGRAHLNTWFARYVDGEIHTPPTLTSTSRN